MQQVLAVQAADWNSTQGVLQCYEYANGKWTPVYTEMPISLGKSGLAWGRGLHRLPNEGLFKKEGDMRAPVGIFELGPIFGMEKETFRMPYLLIDEELECVDDPVSKYYNCFVKGSSVEKCDWQSSEKMFFSEGLYQLGCVVAHNIPAVPNAGSCIFIHRWRTEGAPTAGCTGMSPENLEKVLRWLDSEQHPVLIQAPATLYGSMRAEFETLR